MSIIENLGSFYLGKVFDLEKNQCSEEKIYFDSKDLTTHAVCVGMTGSGKTGLCLSLLEEAVIDNIPIIAIDPKGDISNLLLSFPELTTEEFKPWVSDSEAQTKGLSRDDLAEHISKTWQKGILDWDQSKERISVLQNNADFRIYTPGSESGISVSLVSSFEVPPTEVLNDDVLKSEKIETLVSSLLSLIGFSEIELGTPTHTYLSEIFNQSWSKGENLSFSDLILKVQNPGFDKVGVMHLDAFYNEKQRMKLALNLNSFYSSPKYKAWSSGLSLNSIGSFLYGEKGKPQVSIFSIAHLSESERMFFVSKLLAELVTWVRTQPGTSSLRALLYMDEIFGYFPPTENPPSKKPMLTLLKQARAQGLGVVLATQNPVDLDYKGLSNIGTWFIGRLQTQNDKNRLLEGLKSVSGESLDWDNIISNLQKRVFIYHSVHRKNPLLLQTRWCLSYLSGPILGDQIHKLMSPFKNNTNTLKNQSPKVTQELQNSKTNSLPSGITEKYLNLDNQNQLAPRLGCLVSAKYVDTKLKIDHWVQYPLILNFNSNALSEDQVQVLTSDKVFEDTLIPLEKTEIPGSAMDKKFYTLAGKVCEDKIVKYESLNLFSVKGQNICSLPEESENEFRGRLAHLLRETRDASLQSLELKYKRKLEMYQSRLDKAQQNITKEQEQLSNQKTNAIADIGFSVLSAMISGRGSLISKARTAQRGVGRVSKEKQDLSRAESDHQKAFEELENLKQELEEQMLNIENTYDPKLVELDQIKINCKKGATTIKWCGLVWVC